jgi:hypothetical protein
LAYTPAELFQGGVAFMIDVLFWYTGLIAWALIVFGCMSTLAIEAHDRSVLTLQLPFLSVSESMGNHDSQIVDAGSVN